MPTTDLGFPYAEGTDSPAGHTQGQALAEAVDLQPGVGAFTQAQIDAFTVAQKPARRVVWNSTTGKLQRSDGSTWVDIGLFGDAPAAHAASHTDGGSDEITVSEAQVTGLTSALAAKLSGVKSDSAPGSPATNDVWLDTSGTAGVWKIWNGSAWVPFSGAAQVAASGGTESTYVGNGTNGESGVTYKVHTFTANGNLVITQGGLVDFLVAGGGQAVGSDWYPGASVSTGQLTLPAGTIPVVVGAASGREVEGGGSSLGEYAAVNGSLVIAAGGASNTRGAGWALPSSKPSQYWRGIPSYINGTLVEYGQAGGPSPAPTKAPTGPGSSGESPRAGVVIVRYKV